MMNYNLVLVLILFTSCATSGKTVERGNMICRIGDGEYYDCSYKDDDAPELDDIARHPIEIQVDKEIKRLKTVPDSQVIKYWDYGLDTECLEIDRKIICGD